MNAHKNEINHFFFLEMYLLCKKKVALIFMHPMIYTYTEFFRPFLFIIEYKYLTQLRYAYNFEKRNIVI